MLGERLDSLRAARPRVHCIANYVTANDCANLLLACGASPIMADDPQETAQITSACAGLAVSLGTPSARRLEGMALAAKKAAELAKKGGHREPLRASTTFRRVRTAWRRRRDWRGARARW